MTSKAIKLTEDLISTIQALQIQVTSTVERVDLSDIQSDLQSALEKLEALQGYQSCSETNYTDLWETRKKEIKDYQRMRDAWVRTELFTHFFEGIKQDLQESNS